MRSVYCSALACLAAGLGFAQTPTIFNGGVVNAASFQGGQAITPGSLISIFGSSLASRVASAASIPLSLTLGSVSVTFSSNSKSANAPMLFVQPDDPSKQITSQINAQIPWDIVPSGTSATINVTVTRDGVASSPTPVNVAPVSPGIFASNGRAIAVNQDGTLTWPAGLIPGLTTHPAKPGDVIIVYATGLGEVDSPVASGQASLDKLRRVVILPVVMVGGVQAQVPFAGLSPQFVGVNQLNVVIPNAPAGDNIPIQIVQGGITTTDKVTIGVTR
jgi:uncharacterized protein (TIGR03437 family)